MVGVFRVLVAWTCGVWAVSGCQGAGGTIDYEIVGSFPHDTTAYTQGLLYHGQHLYESTGRYGESTLRRVDPATGQVLAAVPLDSTYFGEGLARVGDTLVQLTWKEGVALRYRLDTLELMGEHEFAGEGWGLCFDGEALYMSDGTAVLKRRDPGSFEVVEEITVSDGGFPVRQLNELECVGDWIYANVYLTDRIVRIDKQTGAVVGTLNAVGLSVPGGRPSDPGAVLNGIAYIEETDVLLVTGKLWANVLALRLLEAK